MNEESIGKHSTNSDRAAERRIRQELAERNAPADDEIDLSDIPALTEAQLSEFVHGPWTPLEERALVIRLDAEVYQWLQEAGPENAKRINLVLKREAQQAKRRAQNASSILAKAS